MWRLHHQYEGVAITLVYIGLWCGSSFPFSVFSVVSGFVFNLFLFTGPSKLFSSLSGRCRVRRRRVRPFTFTQILSESTGPYLINQ